MHGKTQLGALGAPSGTTLLLPNVIISPSASSCYSYYSQKNKKSRQSQPVLGINSSVRWCCAPRLSSYSLLNKSKRLLPQRPATHTHNLWHLALGDPFSCLRQDGAHTELSPTLTSPEGLPRTFIWLHQICQNKETPGFETCFPGNTSGRRTTELDSFNGLEKRQLEAGTD